jgi:hypothetical protein
MPADVDDTGRRLIDVAVPELAHAMAKVDVLEVHKVRRIESAEGLECLASTAPIFESASPDATSTSIAAVSKVRSGLVSKTHSTRAGRESTPAFIAYPYPRLPSSGR